MKRSRLRTVLWVIPVLVAGLVWFFGASQAPSPGTQRAVPVDVAFDLGPYAAVAVADYRVKPGDTFGHIASRELGSVRHVPALQRWNPAANPKALQVGQRLRLPPAPSANARAFFAWRFEADGRGRVEPVGPDTRLKNVEHGLVLLSVASERGMEVERQLRDAQAFGVALPRLEGVAQSALLAAPVHVPEHDLTERMLHAVRVLPSTGATVQTSLQETRLDGKGRTLEPLDVETGGASTVLLSVLAVLAAAVLLFLGARRLEPASIEP